MGQKNKYHYDQRFNRRLMDEFESIMKEAHVTNRTAHDVWNERMAILIDKTNKLDKLIEKI